MRMTVAWSKAQGAWCQSLLAVVMLVGTAFGQTATDLGEGLRAELTTTAGVTAIKWWGKAGRTYFVQSSETLLPGSWQYMPVVEAGAEGVCTWSLQTNASKMFVRLVYTDEVFTGSAADADFDGDGLTNAQETAQGGPGTSPLAADSDDDGYLDGDEVAMGTNPKAHDSVPQPALVFFHRSTGSAAWKTGFPPFAGTWDTRYHTKKKETNLSQTLTVNGSSTNPPQSWTSVRDWSSSETVRETWSRGVNTLYKGDTYTGAFNDDGSFNFDWRDEVDVESTFTDASGESYSKVHRLQVIEPGDFDAHFTGRHFVHRPGFPDEELEWDVREGPMGNSASPPFPAPVVTTTDTTLTTTWEQDVPYGDDTHVEGGGTTVETLTGLIPDAAVVSALAGDFELEEAWPETFNGSGDGTSTLSLMGISASATATQYYYKLEWPEGTPERVKEQGNYPRSYLIQENYRSDDLTVEKKQYKAITLIPGQICETQLLSAISFDATRSGFAWVGPSTPTSELAISAIWSSQHAKARANRLPNLIGPPRLGSGALAHDYILVSPRSSGDTEEISITVQGNDLPNGFLYTLASRGKTDLCQVSQTRLNPQTTTLSAGFGVSGVITDKDYEVVIVRDSTNNGVSSDDKIVHRSGFHVKPISSLSYHTSDTLFAGYQIGGWALNYPFAAAFMTAFRQGQRPSGADQFSERIDVSRDLVIPDHNTGLQFDSQYAAPITRFKWDQHHILTHSFVGSSAMTDRILNKLNAKRTEVQNAQWAESETTKEFVWNLDPLDRPTLSFGFGPDDADLAYALGNVTIRDAKIKVTVFREPIIWIPGSPPTYCAVVVQGRVQELYDWDYNHSNETGMHGARLMSGFGTLGPAGHVFMVDINLNTAGPGSTYNFGITP